jgi:hypothetical protein
MDSLMRQANQDIALVYQWLRWILASFGKLRRPTCRALGRARRLPAVARMV